MSDSFDQIAEAKQKYYDSLRACFTECEPIVSYYEQLKAKLETCELSEKAKEYYQFVRSLISYYKLSGPLSKAWTLISLDNAPLVIELISKEYYKEGIHNEPLNGDFASRDEIFDLLVGFYRPYQKQIIGSIFCSATVKDDLWDALSTENKGEFCSILRNYCEYTVVAAYLYQSLQNISIVRDYDELITDTLRELYGDESKIDDRSLKIILNKYQTLYRKASIPSSLVELHGEMDTLLTTLLPGLEDNIDAVAGIELYSKTFIDVAARYKYLCDNGGFFPEETSILKPILESDEYIQLYQENKEQIDILVQSLSESGKNKEQQEEQKATPVEIQSQSDVPECDLQGENKLPEIIGNDDKAGKPLEEILVEEPLANNATAGGRPKEFWFKMSSYSYSEAQVKELMKRDIWPTLNLYLKQMKFPDNTKNIDSARKAFGAAIIVVSSTLAGLSTNSLDKYTPSMERTLGSSGSTVEKYLKMLKLWFPKLAQYYHGGKINISIEKLMERWMATDKPRALVLGYNFPEIRVTINNIAFLLEKTFHLGSQFTLMDWPEKRDRILDRALGYDGRYQKGQSEDYSD